MCKELDDFELAKASHALSLYVSQRKLMVEEADLLLDMQNYDTISVAYIQAQLDMNKEKIIQKHKELYKYYVLPNGDHCTFLPKEEVKPPRGRKIQRTTKESVEQAILDYYMGEEKKKKQKSFSLTVDDVYHGWAVIYDGTVGSNSRKKRQTNYIRFFEGTAFFSMPIGEVTEDVIRVFALGTIKRLQLNKEACKEMLGYIIGNGGKDGYGGFIRYARRNRIISENPSEFLKYGEFYKHCFPTEPSKPYNDEEKAKFIQGLEHYCKTHWEPSYMPPWALKLALLVPNRLGELPTYKWSDFENGIIGISKSEKHDRETNVRYVDSTKTGKSREYPIDDNISELLAELKQVQAMNGLLGEWVFPDGKGGHINADMIAQCKKRLCAWLGLRDGGVTVLRKTNNSDMARINVPTVIRASLLGHSQRVNEQYYTSDISSLEEKKSIVQEKNDRLRALATA